MLQFCLCWQQINCTVESDRVVLRCKIPVDFSDKEIGKAFMKGQSTPRCFYQNQRWWCNFQLVPYVALTAFQSRVPAEHTEGLLINVPLHLAREPQAVFLQSLWVGRGTHGEVSRVTGNDLGPSPGK